MKLTKQFISFTILASSTLAINLSTPNVFQINSQLNKVKRKITIDTFGNDENPFGNSDNSNSDNSGPSLSNECMKSLNKYNKYGNCLSILNSADVMSDEEISNEVCNIFNQKECQDFYKKSIFDSPECESSDLFTKTVIENSIYTGYLTMNVNCGKDEDNKYCPLTEAYLSDVDIPSNSDRSAILKKLTKKTCKSKQCTETIVKFFEEYDRSHQKLLEDVKNNKEMDERKKDDFLTTVKKELENDPLNPIRDYLKSGNCTFAVFSNSTYTALSNSTTSIIPEDLDSGTTSIIPQYTSVLFITLVLLLFTL